MKIIEIPIVSKYSIRIQSLTKTLNQADSKANCSFNALFCLFDKNSTNEEDVMKFGNVRTKMKYLVKYITSWPWRDKETIEMSSW